MTQLSQTRITRAPAVQAGRPGRARPNMTTESDDGLTGWERRSFRVRLTPRRSRRIRPRKAPRDDDLCNQCRFPWFLHPWRDRKSTRLNSSHLVISYAVFCLKKKKKILYRLSNEIKKQTKHPFYKKIFHI